MPRDITKEVRIEDRVFIILGETFTWQYVRPEVMDELANKLSQDNGLSQYEVLDAQVKLFLSEEDEKRWDDLRAREENPVSLVELVETVEWIVRQQTGRPTETPSPSAPGPGKTARSSTGGGR